MKPLKTFNNVILGQFVLTGIPIKVYVDGVYYTITSPDDLEDQIFGFGMDEDGRMHEFDYRRIAHLLVNGNVITLDVYNDAMAKEFGGDDASKEEPAKEEPAKDSGEEVAEEGAMPGMMDLLGEKSPCWDGYRQVGMKKKSGRMVPNCVPIKEITAAEQKAQLDALDAKEDVAKDELKAAKELAKVAKDNAKGAKEKQKALKDETKVVKDQIKAAKEQQKISKEEVKSAKEMQKYVKDKIKIVKDEIAAAKDEIAIAKDEQKQAKDAQKAAQEKMKSVSAEKSQIASEPITEGAHYTYGIGDIVKNKNKSCPHYGSMGVVSKILDLPDMIGKLVTYRVTNNGPTYRAGDTLTKTGDQLTGVQYDD
jgi:chemotaxis protein histidine kinase CheA